MNKKQKVFRFKGIICLVFILLLLLSWQPIGYSQEISKPVTYSAEFKPLGDGIDWEASVPPDFESVHLYFKFQVNPGTVETEINGNITFDQDNQTLSAQSRTVTDLNGNSFVGKLAYSGGIILSGEIVFDFVIPIPLFPVISIDHSVPIPGFPHIDKSWNDEKFFNSLLLGNGESIEVEGGVRKLVSVEITAVEIAELLAVVLSQGTLPQRIADKAGEIIKMYIGDGGISLNGGLKNTFTLSGRGIYVDGQLITEENQTVSIPILDPSLNSYSLHSSYEQLFTVRLDFVLSSDVFFNFAPFGIEVWSYEKEILEVPIPIVPDTEINTLDFVTTPDTITFATKTPTVNRAPVAASTISLQTVRIGDAYTKIDISDKFSDPDGDTLTYLATSSDQNVLTLQRVGSEITLFPWAAGNAMVTVTATDPNGLAVTQTFSVTVQPSTPTVVNRAPEPVGTMNTQSLYVGGYSSTIDVSSYFHDPDGDTLIYSVTSNNTNIVTAESLNNARIRINPQANGSTTVTVTASDGNLSTTQSFSVTVSTRLIIGNRAPVAQGTISSQTMTVGDASTTIDVSGYFRDPDGDSLTYSVSSDDTDVVSVQRTVTSSIRLTPEGNGSTTVTVTASDGRLSITQTISVAVNSSSVIISDVSDVVVENISADYTNNYPGERYTVSVTVRNAGGRRAPNVRVRYYHSTDATFSTDDEEYENLDDSAGILDSGETSRENVRLDAPDEQGSYYIIARADKVRNERNTRNNYAAIKITVLPPPVPDLVVTLTARSYLVGSNDYFRLVAYVRNQGEEDAPDRTTVRYYFSTDSIISDDDEEFDTDRTIQLDAGESDDESAGLRAPEKPGDYYYYAYVDSVEGEGNTDNNYSDVIKVSVRGPDLVIDSVSVDYLSPRWTTVLPNGKIELSITVRNQGTDDSSRSTRVRYYVSSDPILSQDDTEVTTKYLGRFDINESRKRTPVPIYTPYTSGVFYCFVCIDEVEDEIDTGNNCSEPIQIRIKEFAPYAQGTIPAQTLNVGTSLSLDVSEYFADGNNDPLTFSANSSNNNIATASTSDTQVTLTPKKVGSATITVTASDGKLTATQTFAVSVVDPNRAPTVVGTISALTLTAGESVEQIDVSSKFNDPDNDTLTYTASSSNTNVATVSVSNAQVAITPVAAGSATITVTAKDDILTATQTIAVSVVDPNRAPVAVGTISALTLTVGDASENIDVSSKFSDPDNDALKYTATSNNTSVATATMTEAKLTITPKNVGNATITVTATDGTLTATQTISVTVIEKVIANSTPTAVGTISDRTLTVGDAAIQLDVSSNFQDPDGNRLSYTAISNNTSAATVSVSGSQITITPIAAGSVTITVTASDGTLTATQTIAVNVTTGVVSNRAPITVGAISSQTLTFGDSSIQVDVSGNFQDPDNDTLTYTVSSTAFGVATTSVSGSQVTITPVGTGSATITVTASDGKLSATQTVSVTVTTAAVSNRAPITVGIISDRTLTVGDAAIQLDVSSNFQDPDDDTLTYTANSNNTNVATVSVSGSQITITPIAAGSVTITVTASDGKLSATQTVSVTVTTAAVSNRAPTTVGTISSQTLTVGDSAIQIDVANNFNDPDGNRLSYTAISNNTSAATVSVSGSQITITPIAAGSVTITVTASDGTLTATQTISVTVTAASIVNRSPISVSTISDRTLTVGDAAIQIDVSAFFNDPDNDTLIYTANSNNPSVATASASNTQVTITPIAAGDATITVTVDDGSLTATQTISVTVTVYSPVSISISDTNLAATVRDALGLRANDAITQANILNLTLLNAQSKNIRNLTGLEHATNLTNLTFQQNNISDVTPLKDLTKLTYLDLHHNNINDVTPLKDLTKLTYLGLVSNNVSDVTPLKDLTKLTYLGLAYNDISDVIPLKDLTKLTYLTLHYNNNINDVTSLKDLIELTYLYLSNNDISDVTPLNNLIELTYLYLSNNDISDVTPLNNLTKLDELRINSNDISDISALSALTKLSLLDLNYNQITVLPTGFFNGFSNLTTLGLTGNPGLPFTWTLTLARADNSDLSTASPATVKVKLAEDAPFKMTVSLSVTGGTLSSITATIAKGSTESSAITVTQSGTSTTTVSLGTAPTVPSGYYGIQTAVGNSIVLFSAGPVAVGTISAQTLTVGSSAVTVDVSDNFSGADNNTLEYSASSSNTSVATASVSDDALVTITPVAAGSVTITVTASDGTLTADQTISVSVSAVPEETWMPDANLRAAVRSALGVQSGNTLTQEAMTELTILIARGPSTSNEISDFSGLEHATNLTRLFLSDNNPISITPLKGLTALTQLELDGMSISDITSLKGLTALTNLVLYGNQISDITPLKGLTALTQLSLGQNQISDITPLKGLTALTQLGLSYNQISDITPLKGLTALTNLHLQRVQISDITPLKGLTALYALGLYDNQISDIIPLKGLTALTWLYLGENQISDITPLEGLTALRTLYLFDNQISDISPLENLTALSALYVSRNPISDYAPLSKLKAANSNLELDINFNNNIPVFTESDSTTRTVAENTASGENIGNAISATDADNNTLTYSLSGTDAESFSIVSSSGQLRTSDPLDYETKTSYSVIVTVYDGNSGGDTITVTINVTDDVNGAPVAQADDPAKTALISNYPNPFNPETWIPYQLAKDAEVTLTIYNVKGVVVRQLSLGHRAAGVYYSRSRAAHWDGKNNLGEKVAGGVYFVKFKAGNYTKIRKMLIRK